MTWSTEKPRSVTRLQYFYEPATLYRWGEKQNLLLLYLLILNCEWLASWPPYTIALYTSGNDESANWKRFWSSSNGADAFSISINGSSSLGNSAYSNSSPIGAIAMCNDCMTPWQLSTSMASEVLIGPLMSPAFSVWLIAMSRILFWIQPTYSNHRLLLFFQYFETETREVLDQDLLNDTIASHSKKQPISETHRSLLTWSQKLIFGRIFL